MPLFYHYTNEEGSESIIRSGKIMASLSFMASGRQSFLQHMFRFKSNSGDVAYGNGVYLTKLSPRTSTKAEIAMNNWTKTSDHFIKKTQVYFVVDIPDSDVKDVMAKGRNIFLFGRQKDLRLVKYPWWLRNFDTGEIVASYKYNVGSLGPAKLQHGDKMGEFVMTEETVNGRPVYKGSKNDSYLFMDSKGFWAVGSDAGRDVGCMRQQSKYSLGPDSLLPWKFFDMETNNNDQWNGDDVSLKALPIILMCAKCRSIDCNTKCLRV